jgi:hypothetical protein
MHHLSLGGIRAQDHTSFSPSKQRRRHRRLCICFFSAPTSCVCLENGTIIRMNGVGEETTLRTTWFWKALFRDKLNTLPKESKSNNTSLASFSWNSFGRDHVGTPKIRQKSMRIGHAFLSPKCSWKCDISHMCRLHRCWCGWSSHHGDRDVAMAHPFCFQENFRQVTMTPLQAILKYCKQTSNNA